MGSMLCCLRGGDDRDDNGLPAAQPGCCFCLQWPFFANAYSTVRQRGDTRVAPDQGRAPAARTAPGRDDSTMDTFRCPPRPLPYDDPRFTHYHEQHAVLVGYDKASTQFQKACELGKSKNTDVELAGMAEKVNGSSVSNQAGAAKSRGAEISVSSEDEDECPICMEEYEYQNPKTMLQCNHHFHLSCILEWMERSEACPACGQVMLLPDDNT